MKILELFGGIGACTKALKRLGIDFEVVDYVEIDKYAVNSYNAMNGTQFKPQDITKWNKDIDVDLIMHGSPCQDFSIAGSQAGGDENSGTRSSLMYETIRIVEKLKPKYVIWENVKNVLSKKHKHNFDNYIKLLNELGYNSYYQVLNAKDYGIPQHRERIFVVSIRKNIDKKFVFPNKIEKCDLVTKFLRLEYSKENYDCCPNDTPSRRKIWEKNKKIIDENYTCCDFISTITTKQDRHPNSGVIFFPNLMNHKSNFRYLSPRETLLFMGFEDEDYNKISKIVSKQEIYKQAGNSIVVNVLEHILKNLLIEKSESKENIQIYTIFDFL